MAETCPTCGQRVLMRCGVRLSPKLADIFDAIKRADKRGGISMEVLAWMFYPNSSLRSGSNAVRVSINHINDLLIETDSKITMMGGRGGQYRVVQREVVSGADNLPLLRSATQSRQGAGQGVLLPKLRREGRSGGDSEHPAKAPAR